MFKEAVRDSELKAVQKTMYGLQPLKAASFHLCHPAIGYSCTAAPSRVAESCHSLCQDGNLRKKHIIDGFLQFATICSMVAMTDVFGIDVQVQCVITSSNDSLVRILI